MDMELEVVVAPVSDVDRSKELSTPLGSAQGLHLVVDDVLAAHDELVHHGAEASDAFHDVGGVFHHGGTQEVTTRLPGRIDEPATRFASTDDLVGARRRAATAHREHETRIGHEVSDWPAWYAPHLVAEQSGTGLPS